MDRLMQAQLRSQRRNDKALAQLLDLGFSFNACARAVYAQTGVFSERDLERAKVWLWENCADETVHDTLPERVRGMFSPNNADVNAAMVRALVRSECFSEEEVEEALERCSQDTVAAHDWLFSNNSNATTATGGESKPTEPSSPSIHPPDQEALAASVDESVVISMVESLGCFTTEQVRFALQQTGGLADPAAEWLFVNMNDLDDLVNVVDAEKSLPMAGKDFPQDDDNAILLSDAMRAAMNGLEQLGIPYHTPYEEPDEKYHILKFRPNVVHSIDCFAMMYDFPDQQRFIILLANRNREAMIGHRFDSIQEYVSLVKDELSRGASQSQGAAVDLRLHDDGSVQFLISENWSSELGRGRVQGHLRSVIKVWEKYFPGLVSCASGELSALAAFEEATFDFPKWLASLPGGKANLEQLIGLAMTLGSDSITPAEADPPTPQAVLENLQNTPIQGTSSLVTWKGIRVGWLQNVFCQTPFMKKLRSFGCELWFVRKVCITECVRRCVKSLGKDCNGLHGPLVNHIDAVVEAWDLLEEDDTASNKPIVADPTVFLSYTGGYTLDFYIEALSMLSPDDYVWTDIVCVDQFAWTGKSRSEEMKEFKETFLDDLERQIKSIKKTALLLEQWDNVMRTLEQIWVLWEVFNTVEASAELVVLLPQLEVNRFHSCLMDATKFQSIRSSLSGIDAGNARSKDDNDRSMIFDRMLAKGLHNVNSSVLSKMRMWLIEMGQKRLQEYRGMDRAFPGAFLINFSSLLRDQGMHSEAEPLCLEKLRKDVLFFGYEHPITFTSMNGYALLLSQLGKNDESEKWYRKALEGRQKHLGVNHPDTLRLMSNLGVLLTDQRNLVEAEKLLRESLQKREELLGWKHADTLASVHHLAMLLTWKGTTEDGKEAESMLRMALSGRQEVLGNRHPDTLITMHALANLWVQGGQLDEAEQLMRDVVSIRKEQLGENHPYTLKSVTDLESLLKEQPYFDEEHSG